VTPQTSRDRLDTSSGSGGNIVNKTSLVADHGDEGSGEQLSPTFQGTDGMLKSSPKVLSRPEAKGLQPSHTLAKAGATLWAQITAEYDLSDSGGRELLLLACESLDRVESLRSQIDKQGEYVTDSKGNRRDNPLLRHELAGRAFISKALSRLGLALETPARGVGRPPGPGLGVGPEYRRINGDDA
jgi:hypothetical protein